MANAMLQHQQQNAANNAAAAAVMIQAQLHQEVLLKSLLDGLGKGGGLGVGVGQLQQQVLQWVGVSDGGNEYWNWLKWPTST